MEQRVQLLSQTVTDSKAVLNEMTDATVTLQGQLTEMEAALYGLEQGTYDLRRVIDLAADMEGSLLRLESALGGVHVGGGSVATNSRGLVEKVKSVRGAYDAADTETFLQKMLEAQGTGSAEAKAKAAGMAKLLAASQTPGFTPDVLPADQQKALAAAKQLEGLRQAKDQTGMGFRDFCGQVTQNPDTAKQMNDLWLIYNAGGTVSGKTALRNRSASEIQITVPTTPAQPQTPEQSQIPAQTQTPVQPQVPEQPQAPDETPEEPQAPEETSPETPDETPEESPAKTSDPADNVAPEDTEEPEAPAAEIPEAPEEQKTDGEETPAVLRKGQMAARLVVYESLDEEDSDEESSDEESSSEESSGGDSDSSSGSDETSTPEPSEPSEPDATPEPSEPSDPDTTPEPSEPSNPDTTPEPGETPDTTPQPGAPADPAPGETPGGTPSNPGKPSEDGTVGGAVVDLITSGLDSATARIDAIQSQLNASLNQVKHPTAAVVGDLANLCGELDVLLRDLDDAEDLMSALSRSSGTLRDILEDVDALRNVLNGYEPTLQEALASAGTLSASAVTTIRDTETLLADAENLARSTGTNLDAGTKQSLRGLSAALRQTAKALATTKQVKEAKNTVTQIIEDTWNEYTGDVNNILLMDATAEPVSLTDERNPAPTSVQVLIRTQEIKTEDAEEDAASAAEKEQTTFWGRVTQMLRDFWNAVTGVFR